MTHATKPLRILLSAYACEPGKGSEPGVGWNWATTLPQRGHDVWVITRSNNRQAIERGLVNQNEAIRANLNFIYYDLPLWAKWWKKGNRGVHLYYLLWQWGAYLLARKCHASTHFDLVHHVTFVSVRQPSFMGNLDIPFIFGPVAGGEKAPWRLRLGFGWRGFVTDAIRDLANLVVWFDPLMRRTFAQAAQIYATSEQTQDLIPKSFRHKSKVQLAIAAEKAADATLSPEGVSPCETFRVLYVGHFLYLKGMHIGLRAFAELLKTCPHARLTMIGKGPDKAWWQQLAAELHVERQIDWQSWLPQSDLGRLYCAHDVFFFPSLRDSGGMVVLEAMSHGLPVVCLKLGGPGVLIDGTCGRAVGVANDNLDTAVNKLADALIELADSPKLRKELGCGARLKAEKSTWDAAVASIYDVVEPEIQKTKLITQQSTNQVSA